MDISVFTGLFVLWIQNLTSVYTGGFVLDSKPIQPIWLQQKAPTLEIIPLSVFTFPIGICKSANGQICIQQNNQSLWRVVNELTASFHWTGSHNFDLFWLCLWDVACILFPHSCCFHFSFHCCFLLNRQWRGQRNLPQGSILATRKSPLKRATRGEHGCCVSLSCWRHGGIGGSWMFRSRFWYHFGAIIVLIGLLLWILHKIWPILELS